MLDISTHFFPLNFGFVFVSAPFQLFIHLWCIWSYFIVLIPVLCSSYRNATFSISNNNHCSFHRSHKLRSTLFSIACIRHCIHQWKYSYIFINTKWWLHSVAVSRQQAFKTIHITLKSPFSNPWIKKLRKYLTQKYVKQSIDIRFWETQKKKMWEKKRENTCSYVGFNVISMFYCIHLHCTPFAVQETQKKETLRDFWLVFYRL